MQSQYIQEALDFLLIRDLINLVVCYATPPEFCDVVSDRMRDVDGDAISDRRRDVDVTWSCGVNRITFRLDILTKVMCIFIELSDENGTRIGCFYDCVSMQVVPDGDDDNDGDDDEDIHDFGRIGREGDIIEVVYDANNLTVRYIVNQVDLGPRPVPSSSLPLHPCVDVYYHHSGNEVGILE